MSAGFENLGDAIRVTRPEGISDAKWARFRTGMERIITGHLPWCDDHQGVGDGEFCRTQLPLSFGRVIVHNSDSEGRTLVDLLLQDRVQPHDLTAAEAGAIAVTLEHAAQLVRLGNTVNEAGEQDFALTRRLVGEIRAEMARQGITQQRLAEGTDISTAGMSRRLSGGVDLTFHEVETIAAALGVKVADLIERAERQAIPVILRRNGEVVHRQGGHVEVDGTAVRYADDYYRTVVDWPAWDLGKGMIGQPSSFGLMVEGGQQPCVRVVADGACGKLPAISTRETAHELALAILELSKHLPE